MSTFFLVAHTLSVGKETCRSISPQVSDQWCTENCLQPASPNCPPAYCTCEEPTPAPLPTPATSPTPLPPAPTPGHFEGPLFMTYVSTKGVNWSAKPPTPIVDAISTEYTHVAASFYLPSTHSSSDFAYTVTNPNPAFGGRQFVEQMHAGGRKVILSVFGATELPVSADYFRDHEPEALAKEIADVVLESNLDGVDLDWEDDWSNGNPGLTGYGTNVKENRKVAGGPAIDWICKLTNALRVHLPKKSGYEISHAPQAPYFDLGYAEIHKKCGHNIDYYMIQFYNQGANKYTTYKGLVEKEEIVPNDFSPFSPWDGSISDIVHRAGVPQEKVVVGKIVAAGDGYSGLVPQAELVSILKRALQKFPKLGGAMGWQWGSDTDGEWIAALKGAWSESNTTSY